MLCLKTSLSIVPGSQRRYLGMFKGYEHSWVRRRHSRHYARTTIKELQQSKELVPAPVQCLVIDWHNSGCAR